MTGATVGSRIAVTAPADKLFGASGNAQLNIGNKDPVLVIIDIISKPKPPLTGSRGQGPAVARVGAEDRREGRRS